MLPYIRLLPDAVLCTFVYYEKRAKVVACCSFFPNVFFVRYKTSAFLTINSRFGGRNLILLMLLIRPPPRLAGRGEFINGKYDDEICSVSCYVRFSIRLLPLSFCLVA